MINEEELTGELRGGFTELRILQQNGEFVDINSLLATGASGVNDIVSGGGIAVSISNGVATITNTAQGSIGQRGSQGPRGERGFPGEKGDVGERGPPGESIKGDKGDRGDVGPPGASITGEKGDKGDPGQSIKGDKGDPGESIQGDRGPEGPKGPPGNDGADSKYQDQKENLD